MRALVVAAAVRLCLCWPHLRALLLHRLASRSVVLLPCFMFGPSSNFRTTMPSADFWRFLPTSLNAGSTKANRQISPGIAHSPSRLCLSDIRRSVPCKYGALHLLACLPRCSASSASCSSGQRFAFSFLQIPPRDGHPCCSANTSPCRVCRGLSPPSECPLPGAPMKRAAGIRGPWYLANSANYSLS
jgi:hypothetical protein